MIKFKIKLYFYICIYVFIIIYLLYSKLKYFLGNEIYLAYYSNFVYFIDILYNFIIIYLEITICNRLFLEIQSLY